MPVRIAAVWGFGLLLGAIVNWATYRLAWNPRAVGPWSGAHPEALPRRWWDRLPILGWWGLAREEPLHGPHYWLRPLAVELGISLGLVILYLFEMDGGVTDWRIRGLGLPDPATLHAQFFGHALLLTFMCAASLIDFDEKIIPDTITVPGTCVGLALAALLPASALPAIQIVGSLEAPVGVTHAHLTLTSPYAWSAWLDQHLGLLLGCACLAGWWYALLPKTIWWRSGWWTGLRYLVASAARHPLSRRLSLLALVLAGGVAVVWWRGGAHWQALLSSLIGMAFGGGMVWAFRIVASAVLRQEALGFGDVTLMGMLGAFLGWQPALLVFFLAPFAGVLIAVGQWLLTRHHEIAYGPYLCLAALGLVVTWPRLWSEVEVYFLLGAWIPVGLLLCLAAMAGMLALWLWIKQRVWGAAAAGRRQH